METKSLAADQMAFAVRWNANVEGMRICLTRILKQRSFIRGLAEYIVNCSPATTDSAQLIEQVRRMERAADDLQSLCEWRGRLKRGRAELEAERRELFGGAA